MILSSVILYSREKEEGAEGEGKQTFTQISRTIGIKYVIVLLTDLHRAMVGK